MSTMPPPMDLNTWAADCGLYATKKIKNAMPPQVRTFLTISAIPSIRSSVPLPRHTERISCAAYSELASFRTALVVDPSRTRLRPTVQIGRRRAENEFTGRVLGEVAQ